VHRQLVSTKWKPKGIDGEALHAKAKELIAKYTK
jgi:hypothetical protein